MEKQDFKFGQLIKHSETLLEAVVDNGVMIGPEEVRECNRFIHDKFKQPYSVLVNNINDYSVEFDAMMIAGSSPYEKKIGILTYRPSTRMALESAVDVQNMLYPEKKISFFHHRDEAIEWLNDL
ncbi:hypothetical protein N9W41_00960 [bacterium]|nr:hypothetical protein [bacterium]